MSPSQQRTAQYLRLQRILVHAYATVPFYRKQFDEAGVHPFQLRPGEPIPIPITTRDMLLKQSRPLIPTACVREDLSTSTSSRATSTPIRSDTDANGLRAKLALNIRLNAWAGYKPGDSVMILSDARRDPGNEPSWKRQLCERILMRRSSVACGNLNEETLERFRVHYERQRPKVLYGHAPALARFAGHLAAHGMRHRPQVVIATAEVLSDSDRTLIESAFSARLFVHYSNREFGMLAAECSDHEGLHFHPWGAYVEFDPVSDTPDGLVYRLLATDLLNYGQPLIRYDTGNFVTLTEQMCSCGRWFPLARDILGNTLSQPAVAISQNSPFRNPAPPSARREAGPALTPGVRAS